MRWITTKQGNRIPLFNKQLKLGRKEYANVMSNINTYGNIMQKQIGKYNFKNVGDYEYFYIYNGFNDMEFYAKIKTDGNEETLKVIEKRVRELNNRGSY